MSEMVERVALALKKDLAARMSNYGEDDDDPFVVWDQDSNQAFDLKALTRVAIEAARDYLDETDNGEPWAHRIDAALRNTQP